VGVDSRVTEGSRPGASVRGQAIGGYLLGVVAVAKAPPADKSACVYGSKSQDLETGWHSELSSCGFSRLGVNRAGRHLPWPTVTGTRPGVWAVLARRAVPPLDFVSPWEFARAVSIAVRIRLGTLSP
jgi:hypothetical protein